MPSWVSDIKNQVAEIIKVNPVELNCCNANWYKTYKQDLYWHFDNEPLFRKSEWDRDTYIVSLSFGVSRDFCFRKPYDSAEIRVPLSNGDILTMEGRMQDRYEHTVKPGKSPMSTGASGSSQDRFNLTWRILKKHVKTCPCREHH